MINIAVHEFLIAVCDGGIKRANMLAQTLMALDYSVRLELSPNVAGEYLARSDPEIIVICADARDGAILDFCRHIRALTDAHIYFFSSDDTNAAAPVLEAGCDDYFPATTRIELILAHFVSAARQTERHKYYWRNRDLESI